MISPIGPAVPNWQPRPQPPRATMNGRFCRVEPLDPGRHGDELFAAQGLDATGDNWTYLAREPPRDRGDYQEWLIAMASTMDPLFYAIVDGFSGKAVGVAAFLRIDRANGVLEVGHINYSPALQRTPAATEAMYLMMRRAFDELGYRRYEWKCDSLNAASRSAADRLGFQYEGTFRQAVVYKGRSRDSAWYSVIDREWPILRDAFERWLAASNFDAQGRQRASLASLRKPFPGAVGTT